MHQAHRSILKQPLIKYTLLIAALLFSPSARALILSQSQSTPQSDYQRAFIVHHNNTQTILIQNSFHLPTSTKEASIGLLISLPEAPETATMRITDANRLFSWLQLSTPRPAIHLGQLFFILLFLAAPLFFLIRSRQNRLKELKKQRRKLLFGCLAILLTGQILIPLLFQRNKRESDALRSRTSNPPEQITTFTDETGLTQWIQANRLKIVDADLNELKSQLAQNQVIVGALFELPPQEDDKPLFSGMTAPLILRFNAEVPLLPPTTTKESLIYLASDTRMSAPQGFKLLTASHFSGGDLYSLPSTQPTGFLMTPTLENPVVHTFSGAQESREPLRFKRSKGAVPYRRYIFTF